MKTILLLGTLDTKGEEFRYVKDKIIEQGHDVILVDVGIFGCSVLKANITPDDVARAAGTTIQGIVEQGKEGVAIEIMARGATNIVQGLYQSGKIHGILSLGGSMGTSLATAVMRALPIGIPKVMVSTMASSDTRRYLDNKDIVMIPSVSDIVGLNPVSKRVFSLAAGAIAGMVISDPGSIASIKPLIGLTLHGDLMPCMRYVKGMLEEKGYEVVIFAAVGSGGKTLEELCERGIIHGVFDLVTHEIVCHLFGGLCDAGPLRLEAAGRKGLPQVVVPGKVDIISFSPDTGVPSRFKGRKVWMHNPDLGVIRLTREEMVIIGETLAEKLNRALGPTAVIIPRRGLSDYGKGWEAFYDKEADHALFDVLRKKLSPRVRVVEVDCGINHKRFAENAADLLDGMMSKA